MEKPDGFINDRINMDKLWLIRSGMMSWVQWFLNFCSIYYRTWIIKESREMKVHNHAMRIWKIQIHHYLEF